MRNLMTCALALVVAAAASGEAQYALSVEEGRLVVSVDSGEETLDDEAALAALRANTVTNFVKTGEGMLTVSADIVAYTGAITISNGTYAVVTEMSAGATNETTGVLSVEDGATFQIHKTAPASINLFRRPVRFCGEGVDKKGALYNATSTSLQKGCFGRNLEMTGDAVIGGARGDLNGTILNMNFHTLIWRGNSLFAVSRIDNPGHIIAASGSFQIQNGGNWHGSADNTLYISNSASLTWYYFGGNSYPWTLINDTDNTMSISESKGIANAMKTNVNCYQGPVHLKRSMRMRRTSLTDNCTGFTFAGPIYGEGGLCMANNQMADRMGGIFLHLTNPNNTFTGGIALDRSWLWAHAPGAIPPDGGLLSLTNSTLDLRESGHYLLPAAEFIGTGQVCSASIATTGRWKGMLTKKDDGTLRYAAAIEGDTLDVQGGAVHLSASAAVAGLVEGFKYCASGAYAEDGAYTFFGDNLALTNGLQLSPRFAYAHGESSKMWLTNTYVVYRGYVWNRSGETENWTFAGALNNWSKLYIDGTRVFLQYSTSILEKGTVSMTPGWHTFEYYGVRNGTGGGATTGPTNATWKTTDFGLGLDRQGRNSTNQADYAMMVDPGDGSLFTWLLPGESALQPGSEDVMVACSGSAPAFTTMRFAPGTSVDLGDANYTLPNLQGFPAVTGCPTLTVTNAWTIDAAQIFDADVAASFDEGALAFGESARIVITDETGAAADSTKSGMLYTLATTGADMEALPALAAPDNRWRLVLSDDRRTLSVYRAPRGTRLYVR